MGSNLFGITDRNFSHWDFFKSYFNINGPNLEIYYCHVQIHLLLSKEDFSKKDYTEKTANQSLMIFLAQVFEK